MRAHTRRCGFYMRRIQQMLSDGARGLMITHISVRPLCPPSEQPHRCVSELSRIRDREAFASLLQEVSPPQAHPAFVPARRVCLHELHFFLQQREIQSNRQWKTMKRAYSNNPGRTKAASLPVLSETKAWRRRDNITTFSWFSAFFSIQVYYFLLHECRLWFCTGVKPVWGYLTDSWWDKPFKKDQKYYSTFIFNLPKWPARRIQFSLKTNQKNSEQVSLKKKRVKKTGRNVG